MVQEHPFAQYIRIIGKGPRLSRPLTREEACAATSMILKKEVDPVQLGAFLCILRVRSEDPNEGAGFIDAVRAQLNLPDQMPKVDVDWPTYAGKARQLPYYLLAALCLAESGIKVFMHGASGHTNDRLYTDQVLKFLGIPSQSSLASAAQAFEKDNFAYLGLEHLCPPLKEIIDLKFTLGVRTPVNTFARMINAFNADHVVQCITHLAYREIHRDCADLLGQKRMCVLKGEGGEFERRAAKPVVLQSLIDGDRVDEDWPAFLDSADAAHDEVMDIERLPKIWSGADQHAYAMAAITGTMAIVLRLMGRAGNPEEAQTQAQALWDQRNKDRIPYAG